MSLIGTRPRRVEDVPAGLQRGAGVPELPHRCACGASLNSQTDFLLHNCDPWHQSHLASEEARMAEANR